MSAEVRLYLGLDDTDTREAGGTGQLTRVLAEGLVGAFPGCRLDGVSRHQLLDDPRVPRTRRNRCSCVVLHVARERIAELREHARTGVRQGALPGADPGLCVAEEGRIGPAIVAFGRRAQRELVSQADAFELAAGAGVSLEGLGGTEDGVIGALAAVGLRRAGADGWLTLWSGLCPLEGMLSVERLVAAGLDAVEDEAGVVLPTGALVETTGRVRPALRGGRRVLLVRWDPSGGWRAVKPERGEAR
jgi:hypothetical protein